MRPRICVYLYLCTFACVRVCTDSVCVHARESICIMACVTPAPVSSSPPFARRLTCPSAIPGTTCAAQTKISFHSRRRGWSRCHCHGYHSRHEPLHCRATVKTLGKALEGETQLLRLSQATPITATGPLQVRRVENGDGRRM